MGMYDEILCEAPLPDGHDPGGAWFQTKSFPDPCLCRYIITGSGRLVDSQGNDLEPEGYLTFYTRDNEGMQGGRWREYRAQFEGGKLTRILRVEADESDRRYYGLASFRWFASPSFLFGDPDDQER